MSTPLLEPPLPIDSYPASSYWRVYELELATPCPCYRCHQEFKSNNYSPSYQEKVSVPAAIPYVIPANLRDWMWEAGVFKGVDDLYAACEMDIAFLQKAMTKYSDMSYANQWALRNGLGSNANMDLNCQLQFAHDILFGNVKAIEGRDEVGLFLKNNDPFTSLSTARSWGTYKLKQDLPSLFLSRPHHTFSEGFTLAVNHSGINRSEVLKAVFDSSGAGLPQSDELNMHRDVVKPLDQELNRISPGLSNNIPLVMRAALMRGDTSLFDEIFDVIIESDFIYPTPISILEGLRRLKTEVYDNRGPASSGGIRLDAMALATLEASDFVEDCRQSKLELKIALRQGDTTAGKETLKVANKSWKKIKWREKRRWLEIPVLPDSSWVRTEPPCP